MQGDRRGAEGVIGPIAVPFLRVVKLRKFSQSARVARNALACPQEQRSHRRRVKVMCAGPL